MTKTEAIQAMLNGSKVYHPLSSSCFYYANVQQEFVEALASYKKEAANINNLPASGWSLCKEPVELELFRWIVEYRLGACTFIDYTPFATSVSGAIQALELKTGGNVLRPIKRDDASITITKQQPYEEAPTWNR